MTKKEAIDTLKLMQAQVEWEYPMDYAVAIDMAIAALGTRPDASDCWGCNCPKIEQALGKPEIIRCKDCKYRDENWRRVSVRWLPCMDVRTGSNWYCGSAERGEQDE